MEEFTQLGPTLDIILNALLILGTGAGLTWWVTQRIEERIQRSTEQMNRLQSIEMKMVGMMAKQENMAKQEDLTRLQAGMATKEDLATLKAELLEAINRKNGNGDDGDDGDK